MRNTTALVLAGGMNRGFSVLTHNRAKSALPVCGHYRVIDFVLSNLSNSGINNVGVIIQYLPGSLIEHIGTGRAYDFDTTNRAFKLMPPFVGMGKTEWFRGTADAIYQNMSFIQDTRADLVLIVSGDHIYNMDYAPLIAQHRERNADLTIVTSKRPAHISPRIFGYVRAGADHRVDDFVEKPERPPHDTVSAGIYLFDARTLVDRLELLQMTVSHHNLPIDVVGPLVSKGRVFAHPIEGDWNYLPDLRSYFELHRRILDDPSVLHKEKWNIMTNLRDRDLGSRPSPYFGSGSRVQSSLISPGCVVEGTVIHSVLSPGVYVAPNAVVRDSILFHDCQVHEGARLQGVVSDKDAGFHPYSQVGVEGDARVTPDDLTVVGKGAQIMQGVHVGPGTEIPINLTLSADAEKHEGAGGENGYLFEGFDHV